MLGQETKQAAVAAVQAPPAAESASAAGVERNQAQAGAAIRSRGPEQIAAQGVAGAGGPLPHGDRIQAAFGRHDVSGVQAHVGGEAAAASQALGAQAFATGNSVAFASSPDLHTAAHEAAHVVQQRDGVSLKGGLDGGSGDAHEQHADAVADAVVAGKSAEGLLDQQRGGGGGKAVQRKLSVTSAQTEHAFEQGGTFEPERNVIAELRRYESCVTTATRRSTLDTILFWCKDYLKGAAQATVRRAAIQRVHDEVVEEIRVCDAWIALKQRDDVLYDAGKQLSVADATARLDRVVKRDGSALDGLVHKPLQHIRLQDRDANLEGEWGIAERDGEAYIIEGGAAGVRWGHVLAAGGTARTHAHPYPADNSRAIGATSNGHKTFANLMTDPASANDRLMVLPSNSDIVFSAANHVPLHSVITPYFATQNDNGVWFVMTPRGGLAGHLTRNQQPHVPIHFEIHNARRGAAANLFECTLVAKAGGAELWRKDNVVADDDQPRSSPVVT